jgi:hypothetical protein
MRYWRMPRSNIKPEDRVRLRHMLDAALDIVWSTPTEDIPPLSVELNRLLGEAK